MEHILEINNLTKSFKDFSLNIDLTLDRGYIMGFIGPNGAGKSTTIKLIMNLLKKDSGEIKIFGKDNVRYEREIKNRIGFVYDENYYYEELTASEMKNIISPMYKDWDDNLFNRFIKDFNINVSKKIKDLSKGMKMKFSLSIALSHHADFLIMDEPTSGLDPIVRNEFLEILSEIIQDENKAIFFSTHITSDLDKIADYITFLDNGRITLKATKDDIIDNYRLIKGEKILLSNELRKHFIGIRENQFGFEALTKDKKKLKKICGNKVIFEKPSLEDVMLYLTRRRQNV